MAAALYCSLVFEVPYTCAGFQCTPGGLGPKAGHVEPGHTRRDARGPENLSGDAQRVNIHTKEKEKLNP